MSNNIENNNDNPININGKFYPLWSQFVNGKSKWIGGILQDFGDSMDRAISGIDSMETKIVDITLTENGDDSAAFSVVGEDFTCMFDVGYGGIIAGEKGYITFSGYGGFEFRIKEKE